MSLMDRLVARVLQAGMGRMAPPRGLIDAGADLPAPEALTVRTGQGQVTVHVYRPATAPATPPPVYVNFHGGGFIARHPEFDDHLCRALVAGTDCVVLNVDYDVAPQRPFPVAALQADAVVAWARAAGTEHGWDGERLAVGGQSAGGNLAAGVCLATRDRKDALPVAQLLLYPPLDLATPASAKHARTAKPLISPRMAAVFDAAYVPNPLLRSEPLVSPLRAPDLSGLPRALVVTAELDLLRDEGDAYAARLAEAGVPVEHHVIPGVDHAFTHVAPAEPVLRTLDLMTATLRSAWA